MRNHDEKHKDIIESVLPSRARKKARESRRLLHKQARPIPSVGSTPTRCAYSWARTTWRRSSRRPPAVAGSVKWSRLSLA